MVKEVQNKRSDEDRVEGRYHPPRDAFEQAAGMRFALVCSHESRSTTEILAGGFSGHINSPSVQIHNAAPLTLMKHNNSPAAGNRKHCFYSYQLQDLTVLLGGLGSTDIYGSSSC